MRCPTRETIAEYLEERCTIRQRLLISSHLDTCERCQQEVAALNRLTSLLEAVPQPQMPADLWAGVAARIDARPKRSMLPRIWQALTGIGVAASLMAGLLLMNHPQPSLPSPSGVATSYVAQSQLLSARDPLVDRASIGVMLASGQGDE